jgi:hypothetical protein
MAAGQHKGDGDRDHEHGRSDAAVGEQALAALPAAGGVAGGCDAGAAGFGFGGALGGWHR